MAGVEDIGRADVAPGRGCPKADNRRRAVPPRELLLKSAVGRPRSATPAGDRAAYGALAGGRAAA